LGALTNIYIVWILILYVMYESTHRIIDKAFVEKPMVMLIAAGADLIVNIAIYKVLHGGTEHSHGLLADHCDGHGHAHGHEHSHEGHDH
jgi:Co/Zn/Cd efflux system component